MRQRGERRGGAGDPLVLTGERRRVLEPGIEEWLLETNRGAIVTRYHPVEGARAGVVWVGGAGGGLDGPARGIYVEACRRLQGGGIAGLRLHYRRPNHLEECVLDTL